MKASSIRFNAGFQDRVAGLDPQSAHYDYLRGFNMARMLDPRPEHLGQRVVKV